jgi:ParB-like chromosome segregation protein Spo0J
MVQSFISPVYNIKRIPIEKIQANAYNPNSVLPPEMELLRKSIWEDGYTMPIVCYYLDEHDKYEIVDGFHRYFVMKTTPEIAEREGDCLPVSVINKPITERMASTVRHNRARGVHTIDLMVSIIAQLKQAGMSDDWIMKNFGMDLNELLRLKQISGLVELFKDKEFSRSWEEGREES